MLNSGSNCFLVIYDVFGRKMKEISVPSGQVEMQIDVSKFENGIYFIRLFSENNQVSASKFLIVR